MPKGGFLPNGSRFRTHAFTSPGLVFEWNPLLLRLTLEADVAAVITPEQEKRFSLIVCAEQLPLM